MEKKSIKNLSEKAIKSNKQATLKGGNRLRGFGSWSTGTNR